MATDQELEALAADATPSGGDATATPAQLLGYRPTDIQTAQTPPPAMTPAADAALANAPLATPPVAGPAAEGAPAGPGAALVGVDPMAPPPAAAGPVAAAPPAAAPGAVAPDFGKPSAANAARALQASTQAGFDVAAAQDEAGRVKAEAAGKQADEMDRLADNADREKNELQQFQDERHAAMQAAQQKADQAQQEYRDIPFHNYWTNRSTGKVILTAIAQAFGGYGSALSRSPNIALQVLNSQIDADFKTQEVNLRKQEKFAEWKKEGVTALAQRYQEELGLLKLKQGAATDQVAAEVKAQMVRIGVPVEEAENSVQVQALRQKALADNAAGREKLYAAQQAGALAYARIADARAARGDKAEAADEKQINKRMDAYEKEAVGTPKSPGPITSLQRVEDMRVTMQQALASKDPAQIKAASTQLTEMAGSLMSGGKTTNTQAKLLEEMKSTADEAIAKGSKIFGNPTEGAAYVKKLGSILDNASNEYRSQVETIRGRAMQEHLGEGGSADTPEKKRVVMNRVKGLFGGAKQNGKALFQEGGSEQPAAQAAPAAQPGPAAPMTREQKLEILRQRGIVK